MAVMDEDEEEEQVRIIGGGPSTRQKSEQSKMSDDDEIQFEGTGSFKRLTSETMKMSPKGLPKAQKDSPKKLSPMKPAAPQ